MKKQLSFLLLTILLTISFTINVKGKTSPPPVSADSAVIMDATTGEMLYNKAPDVAYPPASTTKIMTALLTLEKCNLEDIVDVGKNPPLADGSRIYIFEGEKIKVKDMLYALMLQSANDCAEALAEHISGSKDNFALEMNKRALELGCKNTNFVNPSGLFNDKHKTSSKDLALIMRELSKHPEYKTIATTSLYKIAPTNKCSSERPLWGENKLIQKNSSYYYKECEGGKTGYTTQSEHSYVAVANRNGQKLIVALVHDKNKTFFPDSIELFNYGFNNFDLVKLYNKGDKVSNINYNNEEIPLLAYQDFFYVKEKDKASNAVVKLNEQNPTTNNFKTGDILMTATIKDGDKSLGTLSLTSGIDHKPVQAKFNINGYNSLYTVLVASVIAVITLFKMKHRKHK